MNMYDGIDLSQLILDEITFLYFCLIMYQSYLFTEGNVFIETFYSFYIILNDKF